MSSGYWEVKPTESLKDVVEAFWFYQPSFDQPQWDILVPEGVVDVIFNFGDPYYRVPIDTNKPVGQWVTRDVFVGQRNCLFKVQWPCDTKLFAMRLNPSLAYRFIKTSMHEMTNRVLALSDSPLENLSKSIKNLSFNETEEMVSACESFLLSFLPEPSNGELLISQAIHTIHSLDGKIDVQTLSKSLNTSKRTLERYFKQLVGLSPKFYIRAIRLHYFLYQNRENKDVIDAALEAEYYDQSHFIKEFKKFTGETPKSFFDSPPEIYEPLLMSLVSRFNIS